MLLVIDVGNTNITLGVYNDGELQFVSRLATNHSFTEDQFAISINSIFHINSCPEDSFKGAVIGSVVPEITLALRNAVKKVINRDPLIIGPGIKTGLNIRVDDPAHLGADLVASSIAAIDKYGAPCIIMDLGTATKVIAIDKDKNFRGCTISPGVEISINALAKYTSQLPQISLITPDHVIGTNSIDCMRSGIIFGTADMLRGLSERIQEELGYEIKNTVITGGLSSEIARNLRFDAVYDPNLILDGLKIIYDKNN